MIRIRSFIFLFVILGVALISPIALAQVANQDAEEDKELIVDGQEIIALRDNLELQKKLSNIEVEDPRELRTLMFTLWQYALLLDAKKGYFTTSAEQQAEDYGTNAGLRELSLSGIAYKSPKIWTVWLNGERVTPDAIPLEVLDIKVESNFIDLKWYDSINNLVYPVRLRPHERFNLDSRIFLPGVGPQ
jgi:hypothetical protein